MKKLLLIPTILVTFSSAQTYTQAERILDMQKMAQAMQDIQTGFFYNNIDIVKDGTKTLKETIKRVRPIDSEINNKDIYEKWLSNSLKMTNKIKKKITRKAEDIDERFENGDPTQALQAYSKISGQCLKCHINLRKW
ncbi:cytochrome C [bacterium]|nr:cytochrome C [bacterium]MBU1959262.1 cytochrome C [bacterium]